MVTQGVVGLWQFVQDKVGDLKGMVIDTIQSFIVDRVIKSGIMWVLSLLNPASAFVRACKAIIDIVMFFVERGSQIAELVSAVTDSVVAIANGSIGGAAKLVEGALEKALPVVIGFLASLVGVGGISEKVQEIIKKVRGPIDKAIDGVIAKATKFAKGFGNKFKDTKFGNKAVAIHQSARQKKEAAHQWINDKKEAGKQHVEGKKEALKQRILDKKDKLTNNKLVKKLAAADEWANKKMTSLHNKWEAVKKWPGKKLEALGDKAGGLWGKAKDKFKPSKLGQKLGGMWNSAKNWGSEKWDAAKDKFKQSKLGQWWEAAKDKAGKIGNKLGFGKDGKNKAGKEDEIKVPKTLAASRKGHIKQPQESLTEEVANTPSGSLVYQASEQEPKQATNNLLKQHPNAELNDKTHVLTLPPIQDAPLEAASSLKALGAEVAQQTGLTQVIFNKTDSGWSLDGKLNHSITGLATHTGDRQPMKVKTLEPREAKKLWLQHYPPRFTVSSKFKDDHALGHVSKQTARDASILRFRKDNKQEQNPERWNRMTWTQTQKTMLINKAQGAGFDNRWATTYQGKQQLTTALKKITQRTVEPQLLSWEEYRNRKNKKDVEIFQTRNRGKIYVLFIVGEEKFSDVYVVGSWEPKERQAQIYHYEGSPPTAESMEEKYLKWVYDQDGHIVGPEIDIQLMEKGKRKT